MSRRTHLCWPKNGLNLSRSIVAMHLFSCDSSWEERGLMVSSKRTNLAVLRRPRDAASASWGLWPKPRPRARVEPPWPRWTVTLSFTQSGHAEQLLFSCLCSKLTLTLSHSHSHSFSLSHSFNLSFNHSRHAEQVLFSSLSSMLKSHYL